MNLKQQKQQSKTKDNQENLTATTLKPYMRKDTAYLCMFLALIIGLLIGTFASELIHKPKDKPVAKVQGQKTTAQAPNKIDPSLAKQIADLEIQCTKDPKNADLWVELGNLYFDTKQSKQAISAYETAIHLGRVNANLLTDLGTMYRQEKNFEQAIALFRQAQNLDAKHKESRLNEGVVLYYDLQKRAEALAVFNRLLQMQGNISLPDGSTLADVIKELEAQK